MLERCPSESRMMVSGGPYTRDGLLTGSHLLARVQRQQQTTDFVLEIALSVTKLPCNLIEAGLE